MPKGSWAYIQFVERPGSPGSPDQGLPGQPPGIWPGEGYPDQGLPGQPPGIWPSPGHPDQGLPGGGWGGGHPGNRPPGSFPGRPDQGLPKPPHLWPRPPGGGLPVDPGWGVGGGEHPDQGPIYPIDPAHPDNALPPIEGVEPPPTDPPPGTIWPPLPPDVEVSGKALVLAAIQGVGYRYIVVEIGTKPDQGLPSTPEAQPKSRRG